MSVDEIFTQRYRDLPMLARPLYTEIWETITKYRTRYPDLSDKELLQVLDMVCDYHAALMEAKK